MKNISLELLHKYNVQGPRYTSYPPAPSWNEGVGPSDYEEVIKESNQLNRPLSLYIHLPFCEKLCYFCACITLITGRNRSFEKAYLEALHKEIDWLGDRISPTRSVVQFHLGGGTPTYSSPEDLARLIEKIQARFKFDPQAEISVEVDPRVTSDEHLQMFRQYGFNRISMGVQDFNQDVQKSVNRIQPYEMTRSIVEKARALGFDGVNIDLIYGLPLQTPDSFEKTIEQVLTINPDRLAVYSYAHVPWLKHHQDLLAQKLPTEEGKYEIFLTALQMFTAAGFEYIGFDHFARPTDELARARKDRTLWRNFMGYTTKQGTDLFGLGMSAIGKVHHSYFQNEREVKDYIEAVNKNGCATFRGFHLNQDDQIRARVIMNLLCHAEVNKAEIEKEFRIGFDDYFSEPLEQLKACEDDGLVKVSQTTIQPTEIGRVFLRNLAMPFDAYLPKPGEKKVFSRTV